MNKNYTLKELADLFAYKRRGALADGQSIEGARMLALRHVLSAIGYEFPKDEEREAFERWLSEQGDGFHPCGDADKAFTVWQAGREELRRAQMTAKEPGETKTEPAWIPWEGGECPLPDTVKRWEYRTRGGQCFLSGATPKSYRWWHCDDTHFNIDDIVAYRVWEG